MTRRHYNLPSLNSLAAFEAVARQLNITPAAEELNVTPGAVSKQIRQLEAELGRTLLRRHPQGVSLTTEGEAVAAIGIDKMGIEFKRAHRLAVPSSKDLSAG